MIDPYVCIGTPYRPRLLIIVVYGIFLNEISRSVYLHSLVTAGLRGPGAGDAGVGGLVQ